MKISNLFLAVTLVSLSSFAAMKDKSPGVTEYDSAVLTFMPGSFALSSEETAKLRTAVDSALLKGNIAKVEVAVWSDKEHPMSGNLPKADRDLARQRIQTIKNALRHDIGRMEYITSYNMAEGSHWLARKFHTAESQLDAVFAKKETGTLARQDFELIKEEGAPSKAVVILKVHEK